MSQFIVYALRDPKTGEYRYIGKSSKGLARPRQHSKLRGRDSWKNNWIKKLHTQGLDYEIDILEETNNERLNERETWWIAWYRAFGRLTNISDGALFEGDARAASRIAFETSTPEQRKERARIAGKAHWAKMPTAEERSSYMVERLRRVSPEAYARRVKKLRERLTLSKEKRAERSRQQMLSYTAEQRSAWAHLGGTAAAERMRNDEEYRKQRAEKTREINRRRWDALSAEERHAFGQRVATPEKMRAWHMGRDRFAASLSPEERSARARVASTAMTKEERSAQQRARMAALTPEQRSERARIASQAAQQKLTHEERSATAAAIWNARTPEERERFRQVAGERSRKRVSLLTKEERYEQMRAAIEAQTPEQRAEILKLAQSGAKKFWAKLTLEQRSERARKATAGLTPEQRRNNGLAGAAAAHKAMTSEQIRDRNEKARAGIRAYWASMTAEERSELARQRYRKSQENRRV